MLCLNEHIPFSDFSTDPSSRYPKRLLQIKDSYLFDNSGRIRLSLVKGPTSTLWTFRWKLEIFRYNEEQHCFTSFNEVKLKVTLKHCIRIQCCITQYTISITTLLHKSCYSQQNTRKKNKFLFVNSYLQNSLVTQNLFLIWHSDNISNTLKNVCKQTLSLQ